MRIRIVYEDKDVLVIHKPAGLATQTAQVGRPDVVSECKNYLKGAYIGVIHRLDQPVEGLLVFAKTKQAAAKLSEQIKKGTLQKQYQAVIFGKPVKKEGCLENYLYKSADNKAVIVEEKEAAGKGAAGKGAKKAVLHYSIRSIHPVSDACDQGEICLADISIETGRFHQIRCQMAHAGMPLLGDQKYAGAEAIAVSNLLQVKHVALCAVSVEFVHPVTARSMYFSEEPEAEIFRIFKKQDNP